MAERSRLPADRDRPRTPLWVKLFGLAALVLILLVPFLLFVGGGHGPGQHTGFVGSATALAAAAGAPG